MTAIMELELFMRDVRSGQPLHRVQLGADDIRAVTRDVNPQKLALSLELTKARTYEAAQRLSGPAPVMAPSFGPGGASSMGTTVPTLNLQNRTPHPPRGLGSEDS